MSTTAIAGMIGGAAVLILLSGQFQTGILAPGSPVYPVKMYVQRVNAWFAANPIDQAREYAELAEMRYAEYKAQLKKGNLEDAARRAADVEADLAAALGRLQAAKNQKVDIHSLVTDLDRRTAERVEDFRANLPSEYRAKVQDAWESLQAGFRRLLAE